MKPFEKWITDDLKLTFGIREAQGMTLLTDWLATPLNVTAAEKQVLVSLQERLRRKANYWNEDELKLFFISEVLNLVDFNRPEVYAAFSQRNISASVKNIKQEDVTLRGRVEFLVASGEQVPRQPFFLVHEYKPQMKGQNDPQGQLLASMLAVHTLNDPKRPIYGAYVLGQIWFFLVLDGQDYAVSPAFDATKDDVLNIVSMLKQVKTGIEKALKLS